MTSESFSPRFVSSDAVASLPFLSLESTLPVKSLTSTCKHVGEQSLPREGTLEHLRSSKLAEQRISIQLKSNVISSALRVLYPNSVGASKKSPQECILDALDALSAMNEKVTELYCRLRKRPGPVVPYTSQCKLGEECPSIQEKELVLKHIHNIYWSQYEYFSDVDYELLVDRPLLETLSSLQSTIQKAIKAEEQQIIASLEKHAATLTALKTLALSRPKALVSRKSQKSLHEGNESKVEAKEQVESPSQKRDRKMQEWRARKSEIAEKRLYNLKMRFVASLRESARLEEAVSSES